MQELNRCYVGLKLPDNLLPNIQNIQMDVRRRGGSDGLRWTSDSELFISLLPLGELRSDILVRVIGQLERIATQFPPFPVMIGGIDGQPSLHSPKTVVVHIRDASGNMAKIAERLRADLGQFLNLPNLQAFNPTIEIGRMKSLDDRSRSNAGRAIKMSQVSEVGAMRFDRLQLLVAAADANGPRLDALENYRLTGEQPDEE
ncbi:MAG: 2'-5' RNA ligase family protein [Fimbriimonadaceae bacterium]